jgi:hypothetical protein
VPAVMDSLSFTFRALLGPVLGCILRSVSGGAGPMAAEHDQTASGPLLYGVGPALLLTLVLKGTGSAERPPAEARNG